MRNIKMIAPILAILCCFSCKSSPIAAVKGFIFERKALPGNKLFVAYRYKNNSGIVNDSCVINNRVIEQDSINIRLLTDGGLGENAK